jgi:dihydroorotate dehydrogenase (fumarate)
MSDLTTKYLGLTLRNPFIVSASPLTAYVDKVRELEEHGAAAVVLPSLFEEQIELQNLGPFISRDRLPNELQHIPEMQEYNQGASGYLAHIYQVKRAVQIPVIASLNGYYSGGWVQYAKLIEAAGANALELNIYYMATRQGINSQEIEEMYLQLVEDVSSSIKIPVAVKLSPYFTALANVAEELAQKGAAGLVLFNRFYQPDIDLATQTVLNSLDLSQPTELRLRLRWTAVLANRIKSDIAITGGVHTGADIFKSLLVGARAVEAASVLIKKGPAQIAVILDELQELLDAADVAAIADIRGNLSQEKVADPAAFERANYMEVLKSLNP